MKYQPCPFCGSTMLSIENLRSAWGGKQKEPHVVCDNCATSSPTYIWGNSTQNYNNDLKTSSNGKDYVFIFDKNINFSIISLKS